MYSTRARRKRMSTDGVQNHIQKKYQGLLEFHSTQAFSLPAILQQLINTKPTYSSYRGLRHSNPNRPYSLLKMILHSLHLSGTLSRKNHKWHGNTHAQLL
jgi:hypothetical protein